MSKFFQDAPGLVWAKSLRVNDKVPIAAWVPSLDSAGVNTSNLTDLTLNKNDGTLTDMDAATDWVSDTSNGGVRALDFDGVDDAITGIMPSVSNTKISISCWLARTVKNTGPVIGFGLMPDLGISIYTGVSDWRVNTGTSIAVLLFDNIASAWRHIVAVYDGSQQTNQTKLQVWFNGVKTNPFYATDVPSSLVSLSEFQFCKTFATIPSFRNGRLDDIRIFDQALDATDIAYLYNSGNGRGRVIQF